MGVFRPPQPCLQWHTSNKVTPSEHPQTALSSDDWVSKCPRLWETSHSTLCPCHSPSSQPPCYGLWRLSRVLPILLHLSSQPLYCWLPTLVSASFEKYLWIFLLKTHGPLTLSVGQVVASLWELSRWYPRKWHLVFHCSSGHLYPTVFSTLTYWHINGASTAHLGSICVTTTI